MGPRPTVIEEEAPEPATIPALIRRATALWGNEIFLNHDGVELTWEEVDRRSAKLARGLLAVGATKASRIGLLMPNCAEWIVCFLAAARLGAVVSPMSTFQPAPELHRALALADIEVLLTRDRFRSHDYIAGLEAIPGLVEQSASPLYLSSHPYLRRVVVWGDDCPRWAVGGPDGLRDAAAASPRVDDVLLEAAEAQVTPADWLLTVWTSGTTSDPKGVVHTHGGVIRYCHALRSIGRADLRRGERSYSGMPFFWLGGLNSQVVPALLCGAVVVTTEEVEPVPVLHALIEHRVARVSGWLRPLAELRSAGLESGVDLTGIRGLVPATYADGCPVPPEQQANALGMTETFGPVLAEAAHGVLAAEKAGSMGRPVPSYECLIVDPETGEAVEDGAIGELLVRGPGLMVGYYKREREEAFEVDGFYRTGDRCSMDEDGYAYWHGRTGDLIKTSGANVSPLEIEAAIRRTSEGVVDVVVLGVPDADRGEAIVAVVVAAENCTIVPTEVRERLRAEISGYKVPHHIVVLEAEEIPRTDSAKVRKHLLIDVISHRLG